MREEGPGRWAPLQCSVEHGESPLEACAREVRRLTGYHVSPSCAGVVYAAVNPEHDYTLVFVADAPTGGDESLPASLRWTDLHGFGHHDDVAPLHRALVPLLLGADGPLVVFLDGDGEDARVRDSAPIAHARLSPLVFAVAE